MSEQMTAAPVVTGYHHLGLTVSDVDRSEAWYGKVFGFQRAFVEPHNKGSGYAVVMTIPGTSMFMGLDKHDAHEGEQFEEHRTGLDHLASGWPPVRTSTVGRASGRSGGRPQRDQRDHRALPGRDLCFRDPDNIALELMWM